MNNNAEIDLSKAPLLSHLLELRRRLLFCLLAFTGVFVACYLVAEPIYAFLMRPLVDAFGEASGRRMIYTGLEEAFLTYVKLAFFAALFLTLPLMLIQVWKFVAPGLYRNEKRSLGKVFAFTPALFLTGAALAYYFVFPLAWKFFLGFESSGADTGIPVQMETRVSEYLGLVIHMILAFGLSFELPALLYILGEIGIVSSRMLAENRRYAIVIVYAIAGVITPPDLFSQIALGTPLLALYEISILLIRRSEHRRDADSTIPQPQTNA
jgi:sec-independent protein translocase protein TatC